MLYLKFEKEPKPLFKKQQIKKNKKKKKKKEYL